MLCCPGFDLNTQILRDLDFCFMFGIYSVPVYELRHATGYPLQMTLFVGIWRPR
jgi:hypothetical protein